MPKKQSRNNYSTLLPCFQQISCFWFVFSLNKNAIAKNSGHLTPKYDYSSRNSYNILQLISFFGLFFHFKKFVAKNSGHLTPKYDYSSRNNYSISQLCFSRSHVFGLFFHFNKFLLQRILVILPKYGYSSCTTNVT